MGIKDVFWKIVGIESDDYSDEITQEEIDAERRRMERGNSDYGISDASDFGAITPSLDLKLDHSIDHSYENYSPIISQGAPAPASTINSSAPFKILIIEPKTFEECTKLVDNLKARKPVLINLEKVETSLARKMFDFLTGAIYAINGNMQKVTENIYLLAPDNVEMAAKLNRETIATAFGNSASKKNGSPWQ